MIIAIIQTIPLTAIILYFAFKNFTDMKGYDMEFEEYKEPKQLTK